MIEESSSPISYGSLIARAFMIVTFSHFFCLNLSLFCYNSVTEKRIDRSCGGSGLNPSPSGDVSTVSCNSSLSLLQLVNSLKMSRVGSRVHDDLIKILG
jgi:hypothetical protein